VAIGQSVRAQTKFHGWRVLYEEHAWRNERTGSDGFVDVVLEHQHQDVVLLIECKQLQNREWILQPPNGNPQPRRHARGLLAVRANGRLHANFPVWYDHALDPPTPEAVFCVMPKDARDPTVERVASKPVSATEALEQEERMYLDQRGGDSRRIYFSAIVTTARLTVCEFDPTRISLADGMIPAGANFSSAGAVRLTKQLSTQAAAFESARFGEEADALARAKERTVFVVHAEYLDRFLRNFEIDGRDRGR